MQRFKNILLMFNGSNLLDPATQRAINLAKTNRASLTVIDVLNTSSLGRRINLFNEKIALLHEQICQERQQEISELFSVHVEGIDLHVKVLSGKPFLEIIRYVLQQKCDLVIKASEQENRFSAILFGSTDLRLLRKCPCPVWIVKSDDNTQTHRILAAIDLETFDEDEQVELLNRTVAEIAASLSYRESSNLHIVSAWIVFGENMLEKNLSKLYEDDVSDWMREQKKDIEQAQQKFKQQFGDYLKKEGITGLQHTFHFINGEAEEVILDLAEKEKIDLVVMGTVARTDLAGFFVGNTSEAILSQINCSVLAVKPQGFVSPVKLENKP